MFKRQRVRPADQRADPRFPASMLMIASYLWGGRAEATENNRQDTPRGV